jgi:hypothetical protein
LQVELFHKSPQTRLSSWLLYLRTMHVSFDQLLPLSASTSSSLPVSAQSVSLPVSAHSVSRGSKINRSAELIARFTQALTELQIMIDSADPIP